MEIMNWSSTSTTKRYQNVTDPIRKAVAEQVGGLLLASSEEPANVDERNRNGNRGQRRTAPVVGTARRSCWSCGGGGGI